jgi:hypothetical protein
MRERQPAALVLLTPDEVLVISAYRACTIENRDHIRYFVNAAASQHDAETAQVIPFVARRKT